VNGADKFAAVWKGVTHAFLIINVVAMTVCSIMVIARKHSEIAVAGLMSVVVMQGIGYGLVFDLNFFLRNLSVMGGLMMVLSDSWVRKKFAPAGLPTLDVFRGDWGFWRVVASLLGLIACIMVVVGFKAKFSAVMLVLILSIFNLYVNNWWTLHPHHPHKDFAKYDFFQILSIV
jgi:uncharacterized membrane protein YphA (DoxX/SURF4 family)